MIRSMTGFATHSRSFSINETKTTMTFSLKSLNSRYFDANCKLPYPLSNVETECVKLMKAKLFRGSITFIIHVSDPSAFKGTIEPSIATLKSYLQALDTIKKTFAIEGTLSIANVLLLPNIFSAQEQELNDATKSILLENTHQLIDDLIASQIKEGEVLKNDIQTRVALIKQEMEIIEAAFEKHMKTQKEKVAQALAQLEVDESKFAQMHKDLLYVTLDKIDVHEEIVRFNNHLKTLLVTLDSAQVENGKRIDFILQELSREINTISAKCSDGTISSHAINIKVELEKAREQTQNIV